MAIELNLKGLEFAAREFVPSRVNTNYEAMDTALPALVSMRRKGAKFKDLTAVLQANGMPAVTKQQVTSYWNAKATQIRIEKLNKEFEAAKVKQQRLAVEAEQLQKLKGSDTPRSSLASAVVPEPDSLGILVPWSSFVDACKTQHQVSLSDIRLALEDCGMLVAGGGNFSGKNPYFEGIKDWSASIRWKTVSVRMGLTEHLFGS